MRGLLLAYLCLAVAGAFRLGEGFSLDDVALLAKAGFSEGLILQSIEIHEFHRNLSADSVAKLKFAGVPDNIIEFIQCQTDRLPTAKLLDPNVYRRRGEEYVLLESERSTWRSAGAPMPLVGSALMRIRFTALIDNAHSLLCLNNRSELLIVPAPGRAASEYQIFKADTKDGWREISGEAAVRMGRPLGIGGADELSLVKLMDYRLDLGVRVSLEALHKGEYVLVPPGVISKGGVASTFDVYTFSIE